MRLILTLLICCLTTLAQGGPLDDASSLFRAAAYDPALTLIPNEGMRTEPLWLGPTPLADAEDPAFVDDPLIGKYLDFTDDSYGISHIPAANLNGDITLAIRYRTKAQWTQQLIFSIIDDPQGSPYKHFMLTRTTGNQYLSRFWGSSAIHPQIKAQSTEYSSTSRTDTIVAVWDSSTNENRIYINGVLSAVGAIGESRSDAQEDGLHANLFGGSTLNLNGKVFSIAHWERALTAQEISDLTDDPVWKNETPPPPPPDPGVVRVYIDSTEFPGAEVYIDGVKVQAEGTEDKIVEIVTE